MTQTPSPTLLKDCYGNKPIWVLHSRQAEPDPTATATFLCRIAKQRELINALKTSHEQTAQKTKICIAHCNSQLHASKLPKVHTRQQRYSIKKPPPPPPTPTPAHPLLHSSGIIIIPSITCTPGDADVYSIEQNQSLFQDLPQSFDLERESTSKGN